MKFNLSIITPEKKAYQDDVDEVVAPTEAGEVGILAQHSPFLAKLVPGEVQIKKGDKIESMAVTGGFLEVSNNKMTLLADYAVAAKDIDVIKAEQAKKRAEKLMSEKISDVDYADLEKEFARSLAELKVARKYKPR